MKKVILAILGLILIALVVIGVVFGGDLRHGDMNQEEATINVPQGAGTIAVSETLSRDGIIAYPTAFQLYARAKGYDEQWQCGTYRVEKGMGYKELCALLTAPAQKSIKVVIPEGKQVRQMAKIFEEKGICSAEDFLNAANTHKFDFPFLVGIDHENPLEGYLFPATYYFEKDTDPDEVINEMLTAFQEHLWTQEYINRAEEMGYTFNEMIILASIVESEATTHEDRETVAGVFLNRLTNPDYTKLQSCVTVEYAMGVKKSIISLEDTKFDSPYNTYMYPGLPIGPICCPGEDSLKATLYHPDNDYYYFQSDRNGRLHFAKTFEEHAAIQKEVQKGWEGEVIENYND